MINPKFTREELELIRRLDNPEKVQEFLLKEIEYDFNEKHDTNRSFRRILRERKAHCLEGALFAATVLMQHN